MLEPCQKIVYELTLNPSGYDGRYTRAQGDFWPGRLYRRQGFDPQAWAVTQPWGTYGNTILTKLIRPRNIRFVKGSQTYRVTEFQITFMQRMQTYFVEMHLRSRSAQYNTHDVRLDLYTHYEDLVWAYVEHYQTGRIIIAECIATLFGAQLRCDLDRRLDRMRRSAMRRELAEKKRI